MQELHRALHMPKYGWICLNKTGICLNMSGSIVINMYCTIHSARSLYELLSTYWERGIFRTRQRSKIECFQKIIIVLTIFTKTPSWIFERVLNMCRVLNMSEFWTVVNCCKYDRVLNICQDAITTFHRVLNKPLVPNMPGLRIWQGCEYMWGLHYVLNMPE